MEPLCFSPVYTCSLPISYFMFGLDVRWPLDSGGLVRGEVGGEVRGERWHVNVNGVALCVFVFSPLCLRPLIRIGVFTIHVHISI